MNYKLRNDDPTLAADLDSKRMEKANFMPVSNRTFLSHGLRLLSKLLLELRIRFRFHAKCKL